jgi:Anti-sigma factor NepR
MNQAKPTDEKAPADAGLDAKAMEAIGKALRAHYDDLVKAPLPQRFHDLIARLGADDDAAPEKGANASG